MNINKVIVPNTIGDGVGRLFFNDGKLVWYEHGSVVNVYLFHEQDGEDVRAMELTMAVPLTYDKCLNAAEMAAYDLTTAMDVASFTASLARKERIGEDLEEVMEHDAFIREVKNELARLGLADKAFDALAIAKADKIAQLEAYDQGSEVNAFTIGGQDMWLTVAERQQIATQINACEAVGRTTMTRWFGGHSFTFPLTSWKQMLVALEVYAGDAINVTEGHKAAIESLQTVHDVEDYDFTTGYPEKLSF